MYVQGGIDPTYLALEPQASGPTGFTNPLWVDISGNLRSEKILLKNASTITTNVDNNSVQIIDSATGVNSLLETGLLTITDNTGGINRLSYMDCSGVHQTNLDPLTYNSSMNATYTNIFVERLDVSTNILETAGADFTNGVSYRTADPSVNDTMLSIKSTTTAGVIRCYNFNTPAQAPLDIQASFLTFNSGPLPFTTPNLGSVLVAGNSAGGLGINMNGQSISSIGTLSTNQPGLTFLPQANVQAISNTPINIPVYNGDHQILLRASPVPVIDTLVVQTQFIGSSTVRCSAVGNSFQWLGTSSGEVYCYDVVTHNWTLVAQFNEISTN